MVIMLVFIVMLDEIAEEAVLKTVQSKEAAVAPSVAVTDTQQQRILMPHDAVEPSKLTFFANCSALALDSGVFFFSASTLLVGQQRPPSCTNPASQTVFP